MSLLWQMSSTFGVTVSNAMALRVMNSSLIAKL